tara:strand:- start:2788 stop:3042 length:255 start_codon:yes stop_codon:yes gene_type:complete
MESELNDNKKTQKVARVRRKKPEHIPQYLWEIDKTLYKNRYYVAARLSQENWIKFTKWEKENNLNHYSGLNRLIETHQDLQNND